MNRLVTSMTFRERQAILNNPEGIRLLLDHIDSEYCQAESMVEPGDIEPWPTKRYQALREQGQSIIAEDPELWNDDIKLFFGFNKIKEQM